MKTRDENAPTYAPARLNESLSRRRRVDMAVYFVHEYSKTR